MGRRPKSRAVKFSGTGCLDSGLRVLYHQALFRGQVQHLRRHGEDLGIRLGTGDVVAVGHRVEESTQAQPLQDQGVFLLEEPMASFSPLARRAFKVLRTSSDRSAGDMDCK